MKAPEYTITRRENPDEKTTETAFRGLARELSFAVTDYFRKEENRHAFEKWYLETHGKPYVWNTAAV